MSTPSEDPRLAPPIAGEITSLANQVAAVLASVPHGAALTAVGLLVTQVSQRLAEIHAAKRSVNGGAAPLPDTPPIPPELLEWAKRQFTEEEAITDIREIRETGGLTLDDFYHDLEKAAEPHG